MRIAKMLSVFVISRKEESHYLFFRDSSFLEMTKVWVLFVVEPDSFARIGERIVSTIFRDSSFVGMTKKWMLLFVYYFVCQF